jgi:hypothetical protein
MFKLANLPVLTSFSSVLTEILSLAAASLGVTSDLASAADGHAGGGQVDTGWSARAFIRMLEAFRR